MEYFKVMVTGKVDNVIWDLTTETEIPLTHPCYDILDKEIDLVQWKNNYLNIYYEWLENDDENIYSILNPVNLNMINVLYKINKNRIDFQLYYWFDVNRDIYPDYIWKKCPLSKRKLINLPTTFNANNRKLSPEAPIIFPSSL